MFQQLNLPTSWLLCDLNIENIWNLNDQNNSETYKCFCLISQVAEIAQNIKVKKYNEMSFELIRYLIISQIMIKSLSEKELGHAFFYALKVNDFQHAYYLLKLGAPINTSFFMSQNELVYTINLVVLKAAEVIKKNGMSHSKSQLMIRILDICLQKNPDLKCHCTQKNPHYCALSQAFKHIRFQCESDLFIEDNLLILKLLFNGATYRNLVNSKQYKWIGINTLNAYITTKKADVIELLKTNRHAKCCSRNANRHTKCALNSNVQPCQL